MAKIGYFESMKRKKKIKDTIANIILAILVVLTLGPIVFMVLTSLMDHNAIARVNGLHLLDSQTMLKSSKNFLSVFISETVLLYVQLLWLWRSLLQRLQLLFGKIQISGSGFFGILILATQLLPGMMFLLPLYLDFVKIKEATGIQLINSIPGLVIVYSAFFVPFSIWIIRGFFASIPGELEEAARIDGCNKFTAFLRVMLPLAVRNCCDCNIHFPDGLG